MNDVTVALIEEAAEVLRGVTRVTPVVTSLALTCQLRGAIAYVVMPKPFSSLKYEGVAACGARVYVVEDRALAEKKLCEIVTNAHATVVHAFNDPLVIAGQGTIMLELLEQVRELDVILAPIGGGGLLSGLSIAAHAHRPGLEIFACEPTGALDAIESVKQNRVVPMVHPHTIADGLRTSLGDRTLPILRRHLTDFLTVQEEEIVTAMRFAYERLKLVIDLPAPWHWLPY
jgi:threonine dehydratase